MVPPSDDRSPFDNPEGEGFSWPPNFPHLEIDSLIDRLESGRSLSNADAYRLLALIAREAQRLRATAVRLAAAKLAEADREARQVVADAVVHAESMRAFALSTLNTRLDEGDRLLATMRQAFQVELRASERARAEESEGWSFPPFPEPGDER